MKIPIALGVFALLAATRSAALSPAEFDAALAAGQAAQTSDEAPAFLLAGRKSPEGSFARSVFLRTSEASYVFLIRSCRQWVASESFRAKIDHKPLDFDLLRSQCLGRDVIRVSVVASSEANEIASDVMGYVPIRSQPITAVGVSLDGSDLEPLDDPAATGPQTALFAEEAFTNAKHVTIRATVASSYELEKKVSKTVLRELLGR